MTHLLILLHGLWGNPSHLHSLRTAIETEHPTLEVFIPSTTSHYHTYDGIEVCAERVAHEIETHITSNPSVTYAKLSIVGYSLGGLIGRYVIGLLYANGLFTTLQPINFTTFASPHLGVRSLGDKGLGIWNYLGSRVLSTSGTQLFLSDTFRETNKPLLEVLSDPTRIFIKSLRQFKKITLYANTNNDRSVPYYTAAVTDKDPFLDLDAVEVHPLWEKVVLDPLNPASPITPSPVTWQERYIMSNRTRANLPFYAVLAGVLPIAVPIFLANAGYQTYKSAQRVREHERGDVGRFRERILEEVREGMDNVEAETREMVQGEGGFLPTPPPERRGKQQSNPPNEQQTKPEEQPEDWPPTLSLSKTQKTIMTNLRKNVNFTAYPVHITKVRHTHAAIVVRREDENFTEGWEVIGHWVGGFEI
ncbi:DUF676-domain-containing protein [Piedraia hortae CBS 480.64]|uniref:DUF676-domain-containing protein n=1 Tax=Piedraia hortae CBS 480.64 TaxID=1314780 RepID=A0A6A7C2W4_9PEZI|nr:DUF676-domain-containing protein [Piedraia hortae CBS 480.64]